MLRKLKIELPYDPAIPLLSIYPEKTVIKKKKTYTPMFIAALFAIGKAWKQHECPLTNEWIKMWYIYTVEYYSAIKNEIPFKITWKDLAIIMETAMATHSSTLAWKIPWTEEPGRLKSMGSRRVRHD